MARVTTAGHGVGDWKVVMIVFWFKLRLDDGVNLFGHGKYSPLEVYVLWFSQYRKVE